MDRLLVLLFSVTLLIATSPPRVMNEACDYSGGICTGKGSCSAKSESFCFKEQLVNQILPPAPQGTTGAGKEDKNGCGKKSGCPLPICCVCGPCCCLCIVPERPVLHIAPPLPDEQRVKPSEHQDFLPQQVYFTIWKPPSFSV
ncbi:MAG: hypothetical protein H7246_03605 [Phycisphaerae bacterium]|nr:hypothetical protein [Saprospiraceae bacterium]